MNVPDQPDQPASDDQEDELSSLLKRSLSTEEMDDQSDSIGEAVAVTFTTQDYPVDGLVSRLEKETMIIPRFGAPPDKVQSAKFQRGFVWTKKQMDKFVESLLLGYPIPGIFLVKQPGDNRLLVLDGQQRLETLRRFYGGIHNERVFALENVDDAFKGLSYAKLDEEQRIALDNSYMQATIVAADGSNEMYDAIYQIFERLNSGGTQLTPHEIRVALFSGQLMDSIAAINRMPSWRSLYGGEPSARLRDHELILRILAMYERSASYKRPLKIFLNNFAKDLRASEAATTDAGEKFIAAAEAISRLAGSWALRREGNAQVNAAQTEAIFVAVMEALTAGPAPEDLLLRIEVLKADEEFDRATSRATADNDSVKLRLSRARQLLTTPVS
ncbi:MAG: DUF262 domain-containing protein [Propionicimonas sp.]|uniref:DUF262 domain-containing protein n=1 Tax=Propionicimonas sp. TaxID=1955623 RepID=UPI003D0F2D22